MKRKAINAKANRMLKKLFLNEDTITCEVRFKDCWVHAVQFAHRNKRRWYYDKPDELLWAKNQVILACPNCHNRLEADKELTRLTFIRLR